MAIASYLIRFTLCPLRLVGGSIIRTRALTAMLSALCHPDTYNIVS